MYNFKFFNFLVSLKVVLINMVTTLILAKLTTLGLCIKKAFQNKCWQRHNFCPGQQQQSFVMWFNFYCKFGHVTKGWYFYHFCERSYHNLKFIRIWPEGFDAFSLRAALGSSSIIWNWSWPWNFSKVWQKGLKLKAWKFLGLIPTFVEVRK